MIRNPTRPSACALARNGAAFVLLLCAVTPAFTEELDHDFRGGASIGQWFRYEGSNAEQFIHVEREGLRWSFAPGKAPIRPVGIYWRHQARRDFTVTAHYEILQTEAPETGSGVGVELYLMLDTPGKDGIAFALLLRPRGSFPDVTFVRPKDGGGVEETRRPRGSFPEVTFLHLSTDPDGTRVTKRSNEFVATEASKTGRLRLARQGPTLIASVAEGDQGEFHEFVRAEVPEADVRMIRFAGTSGGDPNARLEMRLLTFQLEGKDLSRPGKVGGAPSTAGSPASGGASPPTTGGGPRRSQWLIGGIATAGLASAAVCLLVRRRRSKNHPPTEPGADEQLPAPPQTIAHSDERVGEEAPAPGTTTGPGATAGMIKFTCAACGTNLKGQQSAAGKRVKCPACGQEVLVGTAGAP
jgi:DNA-directed RNA polymerase subunit RPC12/RpoP